MSTPKIVRVLNRYDDQIAPDPVRPGLWRNAARADRVIRFIEALTVPSGVGAGAAMRLRGWQKRFIRDVYEPCHPDGRRLVRDAVLSMGRKNGKTAIIAALVLVHLVGPEWERNGEVYSGANDRDQAAIIFKFVSQFVAVEPELAPWLSVIDSTKRAVCPGNGSIYRALSREAGTKHGLNPTVAIYDELAQARDRELYDTLNTAFGARAEPLFFVISTQSRDPQHILSELIDRGLAGTDPTVVVHLYAVPDECDPYDEAFWPLANPALGDFLTIEAVRKLAAQAKDSPSFEPSFRNLTLNQRVDLVPALVNAADWRVCEDRESGIEPGEEIYLGLDLSATTDLSALVAVSAYRMDRLAAWFWKPGDLIELHSKRDRAPYERWVLEGFLDAPPGRDIDYEVIARKIAELSAEYRVLGIAADRWRLDVLMKCFDRMGIAAYYDEDESADGIRFVPWGQGFRDMAPAVEAFGKSIAARRLVHPGHPLLTWCVSNAVGKSDEAGNVKFDKGKARFRIDGAVAAAMAVGLKARDMPDEDEDLDAFLNNPISARV